MPVDKFGHTDSASTQRVVAGGVTLTQVNNTFARLDGSNAFVGNLNMGGNSIKGLLTDYPGDRAGDEAVSFSQGMALVAGEIHNREDPTADTDFANKRYVDEQGAMKVSKTGDTVSGDLFIAASSDPAVDRILGCNNLLERQRFTLLLGNNGNKITFLNSPKNVPVVIRTANGLRLLVNDEVTIDIVKTGRDTVSRINVFKPIYMNGAGITGLAEPVSDGGAATKKYVDEIALGPIASFYGTTHQAIQANTLSKVVFVSTRFKAGSLEGTRDYTPGRAGYYIVTTYIEFCNNRNNTYGNVFLYKNGASYTQIAGGGGTGGSNNVSTGSSIVSLTATDFLEIYVFSSITLPIIGREFSVAFLRPI